MSNRVTHILLALLALNTLWFVVYAAALGLAGLTSDAASAESRVFAASPTLSTISLAMHMVAGAVLTVMAPLQAMPVLRRRWPAVHRRSGRVLVGLALVTAIGGLIYIAQVGTIGGAWMSFWFAVYGAAMLWAAAQTYRTAKARDVEAHFAWATRFVVLAVGSWIYRMHYGLWYLATDGLGSNARFTGLFDQIQVVAFFVPYLLVAELLLRRRDRRAAI